MCEIRQIWVKIPNLTLAYDTILFAKAFNQSCEIIKSVNSKLFEYISSGNCSWQCWKKLMSSRQTFKRGLRWIVNSGESISFWDDNWVYPYPISNICTPIVGIANIRSIELFLMIGNGIKIYWKRLFLWILRMPFWRFFFQLLQKRILLF